MRWPVSDRASPVLARSAHSGVLRKDGPTLVHGCGTFTGVPLGLLSGYPV